jgi:hypothetical protein
VEPVDGLGAGFDEVITVLDECAQRGDRLIDGGGLRPGGGHADHGIGVIVFAAMSG